jgi:hypothetical protein
MVESGTELISLINGENYSPTFISTDKRKGPGERTTIGYWQIGESVQHGFSRGPVFKVEFVDLANVTTPTHVKVWGLDNLDDDAPIYPLSYFSSTSSSWTLNAYSQVISVTADTPYTITHNLNTKYILVSAVQLPAEEEVDVIVRNYTSNTVDIVSSQTTSLRITIASAGGGSSSSGGANGALTVYLKKFEFCDSAGNPVAPDGDYLVVGYKKRVIPIVW